MEDLDFEDDIKNPNNLTIIELKRFLSSHGVQLPTSNAKKEVYVKLYQEYAKKAVAKKKPELSSPRTSTISKPVSPIVTIPSKTQPIQAATPITSIPTPIPEEVVSPISPHISPPQLEINDFVRTCYALFIFLLWAGGVILISGVVLTHPYDFCETSSKTTNQECVPCPVHAKCTLGRIELCEQGFELQHDYLNLKYYCIEDASLTKEAKKIIRMIKTELSIQKGKYKCKMTEADSLSVKELESIIVDISHYSSSGFTKALEIIKVSESYGISFIDVPNIPNGGILKLENAEEAILPLSCSIKLYIAAYKAYLITFTLIAIIVFYLIRKYRTVKEEEEIANKLITLVHTFLQLQKLISSQNPNSSIHLPHVPVSLVRDSIIAPGSEARTARETRVTIGDVSVSIPSYMFKDAKKRDSVWGKVEKLVERDSRIKQFTMMIHGQQNSVWEWEAPILASGNTKFEPAQQPTKQVFQRHSDVFPQRSFT